MRLTDDEVRKEVVRQGYVPFRKKYAIGYKDKVLFKDKGATNIQSDGKTF